MDTRNFRCCGKESASFFFIFGGRVVCGDNSDENFSVALFSNCFRLAIRFVEWKNCFMQIWRCNKVSRIRSTKNGFR